MWWREEPEKFSLSLYVNLHIKFSGKYRKIPKISPSKYKAPIFVTQKILRKIVPPDISPRPGGLGLGNRSQIQNKTKQKCIIFFFAKEPSHAPNDCSQKVSKFISVCVVYSSLLAWISSVHIGKVYLDYFHGCVLERSKSSRRVSVKSFCKLLT